MIDQPSATRAARPPKPARRIPFDKFEFLRKFALVPGESEKELKDLYTATFRRLAPRTPDERVTANTVAMELWQIRRYEQKIPASMAAAVNRRKGSPQCRILKLEQLYLADWQRRFAATMERYRGLVRQRLEALPDTAAVPAPAPRSRRPAAA